MLIVIVLNAIMMSGVMINVVAPRKNVSKIKNNVFENN
jgi:hypothetical protein